jgi:hypothetical protein
VKPRRSFGWHRCLSHSPSTYHRKPHGRFSPLAQSSRGARTITVRTERVEKRVIGIVKRLRRKSPDGLHWRPWLSTNRTLSCPPEAIRLSVPSRVRAKPPSPGWSAILLREMLTDRLSITWQPFYNGASFPPWRALHAPGMLNLHPDTAFDLTVVIGGRGHAA